MSTTINQVEMVPIVKTNSIPDVEIKDTIPDVEIKDKPKHKIEIEKNLFPYNIVWTPLPVISIIFPFIGHTGICR